MSCGKFLFSVCTLAHNPEVGIPSSELKIVRVEQLFDGARS